MIRWSDTTRGRRRLCLLLGRDAMALYPALLPGGLSVIFKPVIYELVIYIVLTELAAVLTSLQLLADGHQMVARWCPSLLHLSYVNTAFNEGLLQCLLALKLSLDR